MTDKPDIPLSVETRKVQYDIPNGAEVARFMRDVVLPSYEEYRLTASKGHRVMDEKIEQITIGLFTIAEGSAPDRVHIYLSSGVAAGEGGEFSLGLVEQAIADFYNENF